MSLLWALQFFALLCIAGWAMADPASLLASFLDTPIKDLLVSGLAGECYPNCQGIPNFAEVQFIAGVIRMQAPPLLALALFTLQAGLREDEQVRRQVAKVFGLLGVMLVIQQPNQELWLWFLALLAVCNLVYGFVPLPPHARRLSGMANTRPPELWVLWLIQGLALIALAAGTALGSPIEHILREPAKVRAPPLLEATQHLPWPFLVTLGLLSFLGMKASRQWHWRAYCRVFATLYLTWILVFLFVWDGQVFQQQALLLLVFLIGGAVASIIYGLKSEFWFAEEVGEGADGWVFRDVGIGALMLGQTLLSSRRPHYVRGVAAMGSFKPAPFGAGLPRVDFFCGVAYTSENGTTFPFEVKTVARFSTNGPDDAGLASRGVALQFVNSRQERFDLLMSTGAYMGPENLVEFSLTHLFNALGLSARQWLWRKSIKLREGAVAALHRAPQCYTQLSYYSKTVRFWVSEEDGIRHLVRYRLVPAHHEPSPVPEEKTADDAPLSLSTHRLPDEWRSPDYLKQVLKRRIEGTPMSMVLQAQLHTTGPGDTQHWFNPGVDWNERDFPWMTVGEVVLETALRDEEAERLSFSPANTPPSLGIPPAPHPFDPRSIADTEKRVHRRVQHVRGWLVNAFGLPRLDGRNQEHQ